ncbi:hypothetical protein CLG96_13275 [Sphingomonas oleivorans]|uniref:SPOR domain-containing protein n=1 Tax=Sphingomonas oleivorans TaxID=1735121 RepID=A0A2T5FX13_9SPHN|nr:hypothetical protein CLG96_13275 [Sphingomonas oleivorans]
MALIGASARAGVQQGNDAWYAGDHARAVIEWRAAAEAGDAEAQYNLAQAYKLGQGVTMNMKLAQLWYRKAALQGHQQAEDNLGLLMFRQGDREGAMQWIRKSAARGEPRALYVMGTAHFNGDLLPKDWPRAYALMRRAAAAGLPQAQASLAQIETHISADQRAQGIALEATITPRQPAATYAAATPPQPAPQSAPAPVETAAALVAPQPRLQPVIPSVIAPVPEPAAVRPAASPKAPGAAPDPAPARAVEAASRPVGGDWRVQLGAFGSVDGARNAWAGLSARIAALKGLSFQTQKAGTMNRLQAGGLASKAEAERVCRAVAAAKAPCFPVAP